jgi:DNA-binding GntR family transcriptional regulator
VIAAPKGSLGGRTYTVLDGRLAGNAGTRTVTPPEKSHLVPRASLSDAVYERLRDEILDGQIPDGTSLSQAQLAERYGVSRIPIREALRRLQAESLVIATPYYPFVVRNVSTAQVLELVDIRAALEDLALARRDSLTPEELSELRDINEQMAQCGGGPAFLSLDRRFHQLIAGPNTMIVEMIDDVRDRVHKYVSNMVSGKPGRATATGEHAELIDALEAHDIDRARNVMHEHVMQSRAFIVSRLASDAAAEASAL